MTFMPDPNLETGCVSLGWTDPRPSADHPTNVKSGYQWDDSAATDGLHLTCQGGAPPVCQCHGSDLTCQKENGSRIPKQFPGVPNKATCPYLAVDQTPIGSDWRTRESSDLPRRSRHVACHGRTVLLPTDRSSGCGAMFSQGRFALKISCWLTYFGLSLRLKLVPSQAQRSDSDGPRRGVT